MYILFIIYTIISVSQKPDIASFFGIHRYVFKGIDVLQAMVHTVTKKSRSLLIGKA